MGLLHRICRLRETLKYEPSSQAEPRW